MTDPVTKIKAIQKRATQYCSKQDLEKALDRMASDITAQLADANPILLCVMTGGIIPTGHLATRLRFPLQIDYIHVSRYGKSTRGGDLHWLVMPHLSLEGRTVIVVEDVLDGGLTLSAVIDFCKKGKAKAVYTAVVIDKKREREPDALQQADFTGLEVDNHFIYGFGLDYEGYFRNEFAIYRVADEDE